MQAEQLVREGRLAEALTALQDAVRKEPAKASLRVFLFQLLAVRGAWERAMTQLGVARDLDPQNAMMAQVCGQAIQCEAMRAAVFRGERTPLVLGEPPAWLSTLIHANRALGLGKGAESVALRDEAFEAAPTTPGRIDGAEFGWLADADTRLGPVVEAIIEGKYYWVPMERIRRVAVEKPVDLRDTVWAPASFLWVNGGHAFALIPSRYPGSESAGSDGLCLARKTEFSETPEGQVIGLGQRMWAGDAGEWPMLGTREVVFGGPLTPEEIAAITRAEGQRPRGMDGLSAGVSGAGGGGVQEPGAAHG